MRVAMLLERGSVRFDNRVRREMRALVAAGHEVTLVHRGPEDADAAAADDGAAGRTVLARRPGARRLAAALPSPVRRLWQLFGFARQARLSGAGVVHAHDVSMLVPAAVAARRAGAQLVFDTHEYAAGVASRGPAAQVLTRGLLAALVPRCDAVITVSDPIADRLQADHGLAVRPVVLRNVADEGADGAAVPDLRAALGVGEAPLLLLQGSAQRSRGAADLLASMGAVPEAHLLLLGEVEPALLAPVARTARVHVRPSVDPAVLLAHTRQADVGVTLLDPRWLNHRLTLPNKVFEYLAAGLPVVATRHTALGDLVERLGVGWTVPFGDVDALAAALRTAVAARGDQARAARIREAASELRWPVEAPLLVALYADLDGRRTSRHAPRSTV